MPVSPEHLTAVQTATSANDAEALRNALNAIDVAGADRGANSEDVTLGLKTKLTEAETRIKAYTELGSVSDMATLSERLATANTELAEAKTLREKAEAEDAGVDPEKLEAMAESRARVKFEVLSTEMKDKVNGLETAAATSEADKEYLIDKYHRSLVEHNVMSNAPGVDPVMAPYLLESAMPYYKVQVQDERVPWWKQDFVTFSIQDPKSGTRLQNAEQKDMSSGDFIDSKKHDEWRGFFPRHGNGGGGQTTVIEGGTTRLAWNAPVGDFAAKVFPSTQ